MSIPFSLFILPLCTEYAIIYTRYSFACKNLRENNKKENENLLAHTLPKKKKGKIVTYHQPLYLEPNISPISKYTTAYEFIYTIRTCIDIYSVFYNVAPLPPTNNTLLIMTTPHIQLPVF